MWSNQKGQSHELVNQRVYGGCNPREIKGMTHDYLDMFFEEQKQILYEYLNRCNVLGEGEASGLIGKQLEVTCQVVGLKRNLALRMDE